MGPVIRIGKRRKIKRTLGIRKFDSVLFASALESIVSILIAMSDTAITGHIVGEKGLSAMNVVLSILLGRHFGIAGIGMGTLISLLLGALVLVPHFFSKNNSLHFKLSFHRRDFLEILLFGWNDSAMFFVMPILFFLVNKYVMMRFGEYYLPCLLTSQTPDWCPCVSGDSGSMPSAGLCFHSWRCSTPTT